MKTILEKYKFDGVWHFTDESNLESIRKHGLLSLAEAEERGIQIPVPGGNDWSHKADKMKGLDQYVHLAFSDEHPMLYHVQQEKKNFNPVWLKIKSSVLLAEGVQFTSDVSNKKGVSILTADEAKEKIDWTVLFTRTNWKDADIQKRLKVAVKSEILVPKFILFERVLGIKHG